MQVLALAPADYEIAASSVVETKTMDFETFYQREFSSMVALAHTITGDVGLAEDLAQEAMSRAHQNWLKIRTYDRPGAWLRRVTINLALSGRKRFSREVLGIARSVIDRSDDRTSPTDPDHDIWEAVARLPPRQRAAVALFYQEDLSTTEIADILDCAVSTATSHLSAARIRLAELLDEPVHESGDIEPTNVRWSSPNKKSGSHSRKGGRS